MQPEKVKQLIQAQLPQSYIQVEGDGTHFTAIIIDPIFVNKNRVQRQQIIYTILNRELLDGSLHALSFKTYTPDEWENFKAQGSS